MRAHHAPLALHASVGRRRAVPSIRVAATLVVASSLAACERGSLGPAAIVSAPSPVVGEREGPRPAAAFAALVRRVGVAAGVGQSVVRCAFNFFGSFPPRILNNKAR